MLNILGRSNSINVMKVLWACAELGLPFERVDVGGQFGGTQDPSYLAKNPNSKVPTIEDEGLVLWESNVIVRYLAATYGNPGLLPGGKEARWCAEQWMDWQQTTLHPDATTLFWGLVRTAPGDRDLEAIEAARKGCAACWKIVEQHLEDREYIAGDSFSMGDIPLGTAVYRWFAFEIERPDYPRLEAWYHRLCEREGFRSHVLQPLT